MKKKTATRFGTLLLVMLLLVGMLPMAAFAETPEEAAPAAAPAASSDAPAAASSDAPAAGSSDAPAAGSSDAPAAVEVIAPAAAFAASADAPAAGSSDAPAAETSLAALKNGAQTQMMVFTLAAPAAANATENNGPITVVIANILRPDNKAGKDENGHLTPYDATWATITKNGSKGVTTRNTGAIATKLPYTVSDYGVQYTFENNIIVNNGEDPAPVLVQTPEEMTAIQDSFISRIANKGNGNVEITYQNGEKETITVEGSTLTISPVYTVAPAWLLEENYIDNVSTGSGSWSNFDAIESYTHTFKKPDEPEDYRFEFWKSELTDKEYLPGQSLSYSSATITFKDTEEAETVVLPDGSTTTVPKKTENVYAYWQPVAGVDYYVNGALDNSERNFENDVEVYGYTPGSIDDAEFEGWYKDENFETRYEDDAKAALPEITRENNTANKIIAYARYVIKLGVSKIWDDGDDADGIRPDSVSVDLYAGEGDSRQAAGESAELNSDNEWKHTFENLTAFDKQGKRIAYSVEESAIPEGYTAAVEETEGGYTITNSHTPTPPAPPGGDPDPDPNPGPNPGPNPDPDPVPDPVSQPELIPAQPVPLVAAENIGEDLIPQARPAAKSWALLNLLCSVGAVLTALGMGLTMKNGQNEDEEPVKVDEEDEEGSKKSKLLGILPAAASVITFILTEDMRNPMALTDRWTLLMAVFFVSGLALAWFTRRKEKEEKTAAAV